MSFAKQLPYSNIGKQATVLLPVARSVQKYAPHVTNDSVCPIDVDVLLGNGQRQHIGNIEFRAIIETRKKEFAEAMNAPKDSALCQKIVKEIVSSVRERGGRFLQQLRQGQWVVISDKRAERKAYQSMRDAIRVKVGGRKASSHESAKRPEKIMTLKPPPTLLETSRLSSRTQSSADSQSMRLCKALCFEDLNERFMLEEGCPMIFNTRDEAVSNDSAQDRSPSDKSLKDHSSALASIARISTPPRLVTKLPSVQALSRLSCETLAGRPKKVPRVDRYKSATLAESPVRLQYIHEVVSPCISSLNYAVSTSPIELSNTFAETGMHDIVDVSKDLFDSPRTKARGYSIKDFSFHPRSPRFKQPPALRISLGDGKPSSFEKDDDYPENIQTQDTGLADKFTQFVDKHNEKPHDSPRYFDDSKKAVLYAYESKQVSVFTHYTENQISKAGYVLSAEENHPILTEFVSDGETTTSKDLADRVIDDIWRICTESESKGTESPGICKQDLVPATLSDNRSEIEAISSRGTFDLVLDDIWRMCEPGTALPIQPVFYQDPKVTADEPISFPAESISVNQAAGARLASDIFHSSIFMAENVFDDVCPFGNLDTTMALSDDYEDKSYITNDRRAGKTHFSNINNVRSSPKTMFQISVAPFFDDQALSKWSGELLSPEDSFFA